MDLTLEEDPEFAPPPPLPSPLTAENTTSNATRKETSMEMEMEVDEDFLLPSSPSLPIVPQTQRHVNTSENASLLPPLQLEVDIDMGLELGQGMEMELEAEMRNEKEVEMRTRLGRNLLLPTAEGERSEFEGRNWDGERVVWRRKVPSNKSNTLVDERKESLAELSKAFLSAPMHRLIDNAKKEILAEKAQKANAPTPISPHSQVLPATLWTDKYRPSRFMDLLGDDRTHRAALTWLKSWDSCVFPSKVPKEGRAKKRFKSSHPLSANGFAEGDEDRDAWKRPREKVLLMTGPPGLGKTTLAQVVAQAAGYRGLEVNASDDRSQATVTGMIRGAVEHTGIGKVQEGGKVTNEERPVCVIIDEIDGAGGGGESSFMKALIKLITGGEKKNIKTKNKKAEKPLLRPIICICNDLYAPVLRPLRPFCKVLRFSPPTNTMLVKRLAAVCERETMRFEQKGLRELVEGVSGDLRGAMNCLQLLKKERKVDQTSVRQIVKEFGGKDAGTTPMTVWEKLFRVKREKLETDNRYFDEVSRLVSTCGEYDKLSQGCFEFYPRFHHHSSSFLDQVTNALDWLAFFDSLDSRIRTERDYELMAYMPYSVTAWYPIFGSAKGFGGDEVKLEWPKEDYEGYLKRMAHEEISNSFRQGLPVEVRSIFTSVNTSLELAPYMMRILSPDLKPINSQIIKQEEKQLLNKLVDTMGRMKLAFYQERNDDGQLSYKLEPAIDVFVHYEGKRAPDIPASRYGVRQLVTREMEAELIRRTEGRTENPDNVQDIFDAYKKQKPVASSQAEQETVAKDFFGRPIVKKAEKLDKGAIDLPPSLGVDKKGKAEKGKTQCLFRYQEGFSNAVRIPRMIEDFL
ncbi:P-loop containing nucleoside triphosphate hydrolase protein [Atractiella rhizophila]|nr:P-loop containing nucleoside triphosphate hydrolase protein [Atractiella rhizophila]